MSGEVAASSGAPRGAAARSDRGRWVLAEPVGETGIGEIARPGRDLVVLGDGGLDLIDGAVTKLRWCDEFTPSSLEHYRAGRRAELGIPADAGKEDVRAISVKYGVGGSRRRVCREAIESMAESEFADWPLEGPRAVRWVLREIPRAAEGPRAQRSLWVCARIADPGWRSSHP